MARLLLFITLIICLVILFVISDKVKQSPRDDGDEFEDLDELEDFEEKVHEDEKP